MEFTKLPTDNFYIFISFAGLGIIIFSITHFSKKILTIQSKISSLKKDTISDSHNLDYLIEEVNYQIRLINLLRQKFENKFGFVFTNSNDVSIPNQIKEGGNIDEYITDYKEIEETYLNLAKKKYEQVKYFELQENDLNNLEKEAKTFKFLVFCTCLSLILGIALTSLGLNLWYKLNQSYQDKILKINFEQAEYKLKKDTIAYSNSSQAKDSTNKAHLASPSK